MKNNKITSKNMFTFKSIDFILNGMMQCWVDDEHYILTNTRTLTGDTSAPMCELISTITGEVLRNNLVPHYDNNGKLWCFITKPCVKHSLNHNELTWLLSKSLKLTQLESQIDNIKLPLDKLARKYGKLLQEHEDVLMVIAEFCIDHNISPDAYDAIWDEYKYMYL